MQKSDNRMVWMVCLWGDEGKRIRNILTDSVWDFIPDAPFPGQHVIFGKAHPALNLNTSRQENLVIK
jgi:hypothetical protein